MNLIVAADSNWAIGFRGELLARIPADQKRFREMTLGKTVVYGRRTLETFPQGRPLEQRNNLILSGDPDFQVKGARMVRSIPLLLEELTKYPSEEVFVIGGGVVYKSLLPFCDTAYVTRIDYCYQADTYFPDLDADPAWEKVEESDEKTCFDICYTFATYRRKNDL